MEKENSFLTRIQSLRCSGLSFKSYLKLLELLSKLNITSNQQPKYSSFSLKKLELTIDESTNETIPSMTIDHVEELDLSFLKEMNFVYAIKELLKMFPNLKKLHIYVFGALKSLNIENQELESVKIYCSELTNQSEFVKQLRKEESKVTYIRIVQHGKISYDWSKKHEKKRNNK